MAVKVYEISQEKLGDVKAVIEAPDKKDESGKWIVNEFKIQGYRLSDARSLGVEGSASYLYIKAPQDFFERNEQKLLNAGAEPLEGEQLQTMQGKFEEQEEAAEKGFGAIFGNQ